MAPTRWGIVAAGSISNDFVDCLNNLPQDEHQVVAVAGRNFDNAKKFAQLHRIRKVYSSYEEIAADPDVGIDQAVAVAMEFSGGRIATFALSGIVNLPGAAEIFGTKGKITLHPPFIAPTCVDSPAGKLEIQLPQSSVPLNRPNTAGLRYEAEEVRRCLREGLLESPKMTHRDSLLIAEILDEILKQIGVNH